MLTFIFILYQPSHGPGISQRVGWQSWDTIWYMDGTQAPPNTQSSSPSGIGVTPPTLPEGVDWWNVSTDEVSQIDFASLPLDRWSPVLPHNTGISEIGLARCMLDPETAGDLCAPSSSSEQNAIKGKWVRVDRDFNIQDGMWYLNLWYRRTRRQDVNVVDKLTLLPEGETPPVVPVPQDDAEDKNVGWYKVEMSMRDGVRGTPKLYLWYHLGKTLGELTAQEKQENLITEIDVLYGEDAPWYGFEKLDPPVREENEGRLESVWLSYRRGIKIAPRAPPLHFSRSGSFKIVQVADLHFSVSFGKCRDTSLSPCTHSDNLTSTLIGHVLDEEKPDLVVFTGDQLNGQLTSWDPMSVLAKFARACTDRKIPWAAVFGNHDEEDSGRYQTKEEQIKMMQALPYSLVERGPKDIHGVGNYVLKVKSADASMTHLLTLYFLDSGSYAAGVLDWFGLWTPTEYDYIRKDQLAWFLQESALISPIERPFNPDDTKDLGGIWKRQSADQILPNTKTLAKPNALMFFHIPLQEAYSAADKDPKTSKLLDVGISGQEAQGSAKKNDGFFENGVLKALESPHVNKSPKPEVKVIANGHCHVTENCRRVKGVWMCFGGGGSYSGYGKVGFDRRFRIYDISNYGETIRTYKRTEKDEIMDDMILAGPGAPTFG